MMVQYHEPINIGNPDEFTMLGLVQVLEEVLGRKLEVRFEDLPSDDPQKRQPDVALAESLLAWEPNVALIKGLTAVIHTVIDLDKNSIVSYV